MVCDGGPRSRDGVAAVRTDRDGPFQPHFAAALPNHCLMGLVLGAVAAAGSRTRPRIREHSSICADLRRSKIVIVGRGAAVIVPLIALLGDHSNSADCVPPKNLGMKTLIRAFLSD